MLALVARGGNSSPSLPTPSVPSSSSSSASSSLAESFLHFDHHAAMVRPPLQVFSKFPLQRSEMVLTQSGLELLEREGEKRMVESWRGDDLGPEGRRPLLGLDRKDSDSVDLQFERTLEGEMGASLFRVRRAPDTYVVFKPFPVAVEDEVEYEDNPPSPGAGKLKSSTATNVPPGTVTQSPLNERAAFLLDRSRNVPKTAIVRLTLGEKLVRGSLQLFVKNTLGSADDFGYGIFDRDNVHQIGILDICLVNTDRHAGNMLVVESDCSSTKAKRLIPIDHAATLPPLNRVGEARFEWMYWKQAGEPFSKATLELIESIDIMSDLRTLSRLGVPVSSCMTYILATHLLKMGAAEGLTLKQIGALVERQGDRTEPSVFERLIEAASRHSSSKEYFACFHRLAARAVRLQRKDAIQDLSFEEKGNLLTDVTSTSSGDASTTAETTTTNIEGDTILAIEDDFQRPPTPLLLLHDLNTGIKHAVGSLA